MRSVTPHAIKISNTRAMKSKTVPKSQFIAFRGVYHELLEKDAALQNVEDAHMRAELESEFEEESASTKRCSIRCKWLLFQLVDMRAPCRTYHPWWCDASHFVQNLPALSLFAHAKRDW
ncbi:hypothetical protein T06_11547 [Trichinella sp. T6]|nr:hypothetical protein T06_11547 [Trichinella sp. T6]